jgi:LIM domain
MNFVCSECAIEVNEKTMFSLKDGTIFCEDCFEDYVNEN